jgi:medium-chain acyl-[acyl-carrier-protein] hydrolase
MVSKGVYTFPLKSYELDRRRRMSLPVMYRMLQDAAEQHAVSLGFDTETLLRRNLSWVLYRLHTLLAGLPEGRQDITVTTWPSATDSRLAYREFTIAVAGRAEPFARVASVWILLDIIRKRPVHLPGILDAGFLIPERALENPFPPLSGSLDGGREIDFKARLSDIDLNDHVNNFHYYGWIIESVPVEIWRDGELRELQIEFKKAARYGDSVTVRAAASGEGVFGHSVFDRATGTELARARTVWG